MDAMPVKLSVMADTTGEPSGSDSVIMYVPGRWYVTVNGKRALLARTASRDMREVSERSAANLGERLHHAEWAITSDPEEVTTLGLMHDCPVCRAGVDQALAFLRDNPGGEVAVGQLWWAA